MSPTLRCCLTGTPLPARSADDGTCQDLDDACPDWAKAGECTHNAAYMVGDRKFPGACLESCGRCDLLRPAKQAKRS